MAGYAEVWIELLPTAQGGRKTGLWLAEDAPTSYRPHFQVHQENGEYLGVEFIEGPDRPIEPDGRTFLLIESRDAPTVSTWVVQMRVFVGANIITLFV